MGPGTAASVPPPTSTMVGTMSLLLLAAVGSVTSRKKVSCDSNNDCPWEKACFAKVCLDPCPDPTKCSGGHVVNFTEEPEKWYCRPGYIGNRTSGCQKVQCKIDGECALDKACVDHECVDPCKDKCGPNAGCVVIKHAFQCTCNTPPTVTEQYPSSSTVINVECIDNDGCRADRVCVRSHCEDPCVMCGNNAACHAKNHTAACSCKPGYTGDPLTGCKRVECTANDNCPADMACVRNHCENPCVMCGIKTDCRVKNHTAACSCKPGYTGDPLTGCTRVECVRNDDCTAGSYCIENQCVTHCSVCGKIMECPKKKIKQIGAIIKHLRGLFKPVQTLNRKTEDNEVTEEGEVQ